MIQADLEYYHIACHLARNLFLIDQADLLQYNTIRIRICGTGEHLFLNKYDQSDRFLYREVCQHWKLMEDT